MVFNENLSAYTHTHKSRMIYFESCYQHYNTIHQINYTKSFARLEMFESMVDASPI